MKVKLVKAVRLSPIRPLCMAGSVIDVDEATYGRLVELGAVEVEPEPTSEPEPVVESEPVVEDAPESEATPGPEPEAGVVRKPAKSAPEDKWRAYAESLGLDVKGLKKPEIIAVVNKATA